MVPILHTLNSDSIEAKSFRRMPTESPLSMSGHSLHDVKHNDAEVNRLAHHNLIITS